MLWQYYTWSAVRETACQVASLASLQEKQKQETADQCVNLKKQWRDLELGAKETECQAVSGRDKQTWSTLWDSSTASIPGLGSVCGSRWILLHPFLLLVCVSVFVFFGNCKTDIVMCVFYCRRTENFLQRFERTAPRPLASSSAILTSSRVSQQPQSECVCVHSYVLSHVLFAWRVHISIGEGEGVYSNQKWPG